ncbi:MAG: hypothetical protein K2M07_03640 [Muribaculaceae bacterium]|nr:hypothetical protein [Muribaculaceae bacterium]
MITPEELFNKLVYDHLGKFTLLRIIEDIANESSIKTLNFFSEELEELCKEYVKEGIHFKDIVKFDPSLLSWGVHTDPPGYKYNQILEEYGLTPEPDHIDITEYYKPFGYDFVIENLTKIIEEKGRANDTQDLSNSKIIAEVTEAGTEKHNIPEVFLTPEAQKYLNVAIAVGLINEQYDWLPKNPKGAKHLTLLAYFACKMSDALKLGPGRNSDGRPRIRWQPFEELFKLKKGSLRILYNEIQKTGQKPIGSDLVDRVFE